MQCVVVCSEVIFIFCRKVILMSRDIGLFVRLDTVWKLGKGWVISVQDPQREGVVKGAIGCDVWDEVLDGSHCGLHLGVVIAGCGCGLVL